MKLTAGLLKVAAAILIVAALLVLCASMFGLVGFHYPSVVQDEPLRDPQKVVRVDGTNLILQNGMVIAIDSIYALDMSNKLSQSAFEIDIIGAKGEPVVIYARQHGWICGTPWAQPIRIPLVRDTVYKNRRELIAVGSYVESNGRQGGAAAREQPEGARLSRTQAIKLARDAAQRNGINLADFKEPEPRFHSRTTRKEWSVFFIPKHWAPGQDFSIWIDDQTEKATVVGGM